MIHRKKILMGLAVAILVTLNLWKWWPGTKLHDIGTKLPSEQVRAEQLVLLIDLGERTGRDQVKRDIFQSKRNTVPVVQIKMKRVPIQESPQQKTPDELEQDAAEMELTEYRCVGIAVHDGITQAFLIRGDQNIVVTHGDRVSARFIVDKITLDEVVLKDNSTGVGGVIKMAGK
jgi:hypothetical protein